MDPSVADLTKKVRELSSLLEVSRLVDSDMENDRAARLVLQKAMQVMAAESGTLWLTAGAGRDVEAHAMLGPGPAAALRAGLARGKAIAEQVSRTGVGRLDIASPRRAGLGARSMVTAPLPGQAGPVGCLQLVNKRDGLAFDDADLQLLTAVGTQAALVIENAWQLEQLRRLTVSAQDAWRGALDALASALATRDYETEAHGQRTVEMTLLLARRMSVPEARLPSMVRGALLHDIGKIGIPDRILFKAGPLTVEEREVVKQHVVLGFNMLRHIPFFTEAMPVVLHHHESYDGTGFPYGLKGDAIPLGARIFHVADVYDALISERPYKHAWSADRALEELRQGAGRDYDPAAVAALTSLSAGELAWLHDIADFQPATRELLGQP